MPKIDEKGAEIEKEVEVAEEVKIEVEVEVRLGRDCGRGSGRVRGRNEGSAEVEERQATVALPWPGIESEAFPWHRQRRSSLTEAAAYF